ncbi:MAG TPA: hypothetical protein DD811_01725 [Syntrophomonas sp.]|nr:hypothetical protein [Syntrophomonas sp.]
MKSKSNSFRRLELRLPVDHPVWNLPQGERSRIVREWLEIGSRLAAMESSLTRIEACLSNSVPSALPCELPKAERPSPFNVDAFLSHFG